MKISKALSSAIKAADGKIPSAGEELLASQLKEARIPFIREFLFHPSRKWRFDFKLANSQYAIEVEGGVWAKGRHNRPSGFIADLEKYNAAAVMGFRVLRYPTEQVISGVAISEIVGLFI